MHTLPPNPRNGLKHGSSAKVKGGREAEKLKYSGRAAERELAVGIYKIQSLNLWAVCNKGGDVHIHMCVCVVVVLFFFFTSMRSDGTKAERARVLDRRKCIEIPNRLNKQEPEELEERESLG